MKQFVLYNGEVWEVVREDCQGDETHWLLDSAEDRIKLRFVPREDCAPLDPALNVLFERKENG